MDEEITELDLWLVQQPKLPPDIAVTIWSRAAYCEWLYYGDATPAQQHQLLLRLRECVREFQKLPQKWQEALWPIGYARWHAQFLEEEEEEKRNATA